MPRLSRWSRRSGRTDDAAPELDAETAQGRRLASEEVLALVAAAEAEAAEAEAQAAEAAALAARARAEAPGQPAPEPSPAEPAAADSQTEPETQPEPDAPTPEAPESSAEETDAGRPARRPRLTAALGAWVAAAVAMVLVGILIGLSAFIVWNRGAQREIAEHKAAFVAAANQGVVNLLSMDFTKGDEDLQRLIDSTTGEFRDDFERSRGDFLTVLRSSKVTTTAEVKTSAVEELYRDSAVVLVAAGSEVSNTAAAKQPPRAWRLRVTVSRDGDQIKMSKVEFVL